MMTYFFGSWTLRLTLVSLFIYPQLSVARMEVELRQSQYISPAPAGQFDQYSHLLFRGRWSPETKNFKSGIDIGAVSSFHEGEGQHFLVPELYISTTDVVTTWSLGRKKLPWSRFDKLWGFGLWEPHFKWDPIHPERQGLIGLFFEVKRPNFQAHFLSSPLFLPDQGPNYALRDGRLESSHRWIRRPLTTLNLNNINTEIIYELDRPSVAEVIGQYSLGFWGRLGSHSMKGPWLQMALAVKPMNQFSIAVEGHQLLAAGSKALNSEATIHPYLTRHQIMSLETGWTGDELEFWTSLTSETGESENNLPVEWDKTPIGQSYYGGLHLAQRLGRLGFVNTFLEMSYLKVENQYEDVPATLVQGRAAGSLSRFPFNEAAQIVIRKNPSQIFGARIGGSLRYLYSLEEQGALMSAQMNFWLRSRIKFRLALDILGFDGDSSRDGFFSRNQGNDRVELGVSYAF